jgi:hypothetical protein
MQAAPRPLPSAVQNEPILICEQGYEETNSADKGDY